MNDNKITKVVEVVKIVEIIEINRYDIPQNSSSPKASRQRKVFGRIGGCQSVGLHSRFVRWWRTAIKVRKRKEKRRGEGGRWEDGTYVL